MEDSGSDTQYTLHCLHHLPWIHPWVPGGTWHGDHKPWSKNDSAGYSHKGSGTPHNIPESAQGIRCLGQVQVPENNEGIWHGSQVPPTPPQILGEAPYVGAGGGVLWSTLTRKERRGTGVPTVAYHLQCGGGPSGPPLGVTGNWVNGETSAMTTSQGRRHRDKLPGEGTTGEGWKKRDTCSWRCKQIFLRRRPEGSLHWYGVDPDRVRHTDGDLWLGGTEEKNVWKTVGMVFQTRKAVGVRADEAYKRRMAWEGRSYWERQQEWV